MADPDQSARRLERTLVHTFAQDRGWKAARPIIHEVSTSLSAGSLAASAELSARRLLELLDWSGEVVADVEVAETSRTGRLVELTRLASCNGYLCGTGGLRYLDPKEFEQQGISVKFLDYRALLEAVGLADCYRLSALDLLCRCGPERFQEIMAALAERAKSRS